MNWGGVEDEACDAAAAAMREGGEMKRKGERNELGRSGKTMRRVCCVMLLPR